MIATMRTPKYGVPFLALAFTLTGALFVTSWKIDRDRRHDVCQLSYSIVSRQVEGTRWQIAQGVVFQQSSKAPEVRAFYRANLPKRRAALTNARADLASLHCKPKGPNP